MAKYIIITLILTVILSSICFVGLKVISPPGDGGINNPILAILGGICFISMLVIMFPSWLTMSIFNISENTFTVLVTPDF